jgi:hypothetical protein
MQTNPASTLGNARGLATASCRNQPTHEQFVRIDCPQAGRQADKLAEDFRHAMDLCTPYDPFRHFNNLQLRESIEPSKQGWRHTLNQVFVEGAAIVSHKTPST